MINGETIRRYMMFPRRRVHAPAAVRSASVTEEGIPWGRTIQFLSVLATGHGSCLRERDRMGLPPFRIGDADATRWSTKIEKVSEGDTKRGAEPRLGARTG